MLRIEEGMPRTSYIQYFGNSTFATMQHTLALDNLEQALAYGFTPRWNNAFARAHVPQPLAGTLCVLNPIDGANDTKPLGFPDSCLPRKPTAI